MISAGHRAPESCLQRKTWVLPVLQDRSTVSVKPDVKTTHREKMPPRRPPSPANHWQQEPHVKQVHQALPYFSQRKYVAYLASAALHDRANFPKVSFSQQHLNLLFLTPVMQHKSQNLPMKKRVNMLGNWRQGKLCSIGTREEWCPHCLKAPEFWLNPRMLGRCKNLRISSCSRSTQRGALVVQGGIKLGSGWRNESGISQAHLFRHPTNI